MCEEYALLRPRLLRAIKGKKTARGIARAMYKALCEFAADIGMKPEIEVAIWTPQQVRERNMRGDAAGSNYWLVSFEAGPDDWAVKFSCDSGVTRLMEPYYSFDLCIYPADDSPRSKRAA